MYKYQVVLLFLSLYNIGIRSWNLPSILEDDAQFYHVRCDLELLETGKTFMLEEWTSVVRQTFRMDLIEYPGGTRHSYLSDKKTDEKYHYEPFKCSRISDFVNSLDKELKDKFPVSDTIMPTGVGSLWLYGLKYNASHLTSRGLKPNEELGASSSFILRNFIRYSIEATDLLPYRVDYYFRPKMVESLKSIAMIQLTQSKTHTVVFRIKFLEMNSSWKSTEIDESDIFDLPLGYGCAKTDKADTLPPATHNSIEGYQPHLLHLDVIASQPMDLKYDDYEQWRSHSSSIKIFTGRLNLNQEITNDYIALETHDYAPLDQIEVFYGVHINKATLRRIKRVWDLGKEGLIQDRKSTGLYFKIDEKGGKCLTNGENQSLNEKTGFEVPLFSQNRAASNQSLPSILNINLVKMLFSSEFGYHLLRQIRKKTTKQIEEYIYEKRVDVFTIRNLMGEINWTGPVSIIRQDIVESFDSKYNSNHQTNIEIRFLSSNLDRVITKVQLTLVVDEIIDQAYFHQVLDVSQCLSDKKQKSNPLNYLSDTKIKSEMLDFVINYPIDSLEVSNELSSSDSSESIIYEQFLHSIFEASEQRLDLLQVNDIAIDFSPDLLKISGKLIKKPSIFSYDITINQKIMHRDSNQLFTEFKSNDEDCAQSCSHYHCFSFVYCQRTNVCQLLMEDIRLAGGLNLEFDFKCNLYTPRSDKTHSIEPSQVIYQLQHSILTQSKTNDKIDVLSLKLEHPSDGDNRDIVLRPVSIESGSHVYEILDDIIDEMTNNDETRKLSKFMMMSRNKDDQIINKEKNLILYPDYNQIFNGRRYKVPKEPNNQFPIKLAHYKSYQNCESLCDELDCRSFSYCLIEDTCLISELHQTSLIEANSEKASFCSIMSRDYLSKFQKAMQVPRPRAKTIKSIKTELSRDCAVNCMDEQEFKCRSFYYCPADDISKFNCYLAKSHGPSEENSLNLTDEFQTSCQLYIRSYLMEFDKFYGKSLSAGMESTTLIEDSTAEFCALECAESQENCQAFHVCRDETLLKPVCLMLNQQNRQNVLVNLEKNDNCTAFIVNKQSTLNRSFGNSNKFDEFESEASNFYTIIIKLLFIAIGLASGYISALAMNGYLQRAKRHFQTPIEVSFWCVRYDEKD